ncbi:MAG: YciI family protein [Methanobrevibacter sp.]|nr:YciI family protein [Methanobrevibacter sp.]
MNKFLVIYSDSGKKPDASAEELILTHVDYIKSLAKEGTLSLCGVFMDNSGAVLVFNAASSKEVESILEKDPLVKEKYYNFTITEFIEANEENNFLLDCDNQ